ncbi:sunset domain-containing protein [Amycolatopsis aidingensis]|uniref:sunset domain-containing protein n=1 Tax=Amycolatopsis aidingensis TaxID=2842453 RepID=UPI001C0BB44C|nr:hypothetical protein [Amycolatopsis aidingensis]
MSIFGQVWLWSLAAFVLGALLTWLLLVRPAQSRIADLERRLAAAPTPERGQLHQDPEPTLVQHQPAAASSGDGPGLDPDALPGVPEPAEETAAERTRFVGPVEPQPQPQWLEQDSFAQAGRDADEPTEYRYAEEPPRYGDQDEEYGQYEPYGQYDQYLQETHPDEEAEQAWDSTQALSVLEPGQEDQYEYEAARPEPEPEPEPRERQPASLFTELPAYEYVDEDSDYNDYNGDAGYRDYGQHEDQPEQQHAEYEGEQPGEPPAETPSPPDTTQVLPKRQPREVPRGGFDQPEPIQPSMRTVSRREPAPEVEGTHSGSLFQPAVPAGPAAEQPGPVPPPARDHVPEEGGALPSGPFGPGSAMPLPGGGSPAEDYRVKASVTALRYCTEDEPRYPNMVAEVWFRTPADAERVGFRPLT